MSVSYTHLDVYKRQLNMGAVAKRYKPGELDALAFKAGNDIMLFSDGVKEGKRLIQVAIDNKEISQNRVEELSLIHI